MTGRRLRVLVVGQAPTTPGGIASVQRLHETALRRRPDTEVTTVVTFDETGALGRLVRMVTGLTRALALVLAGRVDVVHLHMAKGLSVFRKGIVVTAARLRGVPTVLHTHAGAFATWFDGLPGPVRSLVVQMLRPDRLVVLLDDARAVYTERLRIPPEHVVVLANPVEWPESVPAGSAAGPLEAAFLGRLIDRKGVFDLIDALAGLSADLRPHLHVTLAGHGDDDAVRRAVADAGLDTTVAVRSWLGPAERDELLARSALLLLPSWWEALPMAVLEAMAWGVTPVVTPVGGLVDLVRDGHNGVVVPVRDPGSLTAALEKILLDDDTRRRLGSQARVDVRGYGVDAWGERMTTVYRELVDHRH